MTFSLVVVPRSNFDGLPHPSKNTCTNPGPCTPVTSAPSISAVLDGPEMIVMLGARGAAASFSNRSIRSARNWVHL